MKVPCVVKVASSKDCLAHVSPTLISALFPTNPEGIPIVKATCGSSDCFLSLVSVSLNEKTDLRINGLYANKLGIRDGSDILLESVQHVHPCISAWLEPLTVDDWEILELHANEVENRLLDQLRVVWPGQVFPLWVDQNVCIYMRTVKTEPDVDCCSLIHLSQLIVEPKVHGTIQSHNQVTAKIHKNTSSGVVKAADLSPKSKKDDEKKVTNPHRWILFCRLYRAVKFIVMYIWKQCFLNIYAHLRSIIFPTSNNELPSEYSEGKINKESILAVINLLPAKFDIALRVEAAEDMQFTSRPISLYEQPNTVFLHMPDTLQDDDSVLHFVLFSKISSPLEKGKVSSKVAQQKHQKAELSNKQASDLTSRKLQESCVVRMFVHPRSNFAMISGSTTLDMHHLKVPLCLRRQMHLGCSSRARIQKLDNLPLLLDDVKSIMFSVNSCSKQLKSEDFNTVLSHFKSWLTNVCDVDSPLPIAVGTLLTFSVVFEQDSCEDNSESLELVVAEILSNKNDSNNFTYLLCPDDLHHISVNFKLAKLYDIPTEVDPEIPNESIHLYCNGLEETSTQIIQQLQFSLKARPMVAHLSSKLTGPSVLLLTGPGGNGKTTLCRAAMRKFSLDPTVSAYTHSLNCSQLFGKKPKNIKKKLDCVIAELLWRQPSILLLDDLDHLVGSVSGEEERTSDSFYIAHVAYLIKRSLKSLTSSHQLSSRVAVIVTSKSKTTIHPLLTCVTDHIFTEHIHLHLPGKLNRENMFRSVIENLTDFECPIDIRSVLDKTEGFAISDIVKVVRRSCHLLELDKDGSGGNVLPARKMLESLQHLTPVSLQNARLHKPSPLSWRHVGGLKTVKQKLLEQLVWPLKYRHVFDECGFKAQSGILLFGPPGCGKTLVAGVVANECGLNFISVKGPELLSKYIGASEAAVRDLFSRAKAAAPCVLFFDEFDSLAPPRGHDSTGVTDRVVNQLLTHLDGVEPLVGVTVMAASSRPDLIDPALLRPGRLDNLLHCPMPDSAERLDILTSLSSDLTLHSDISLEQLADECKNFSGADLKALLYNSQLEAVHDMCKDTIPFEPSLQQSERAEFQLYSSNSESSTLSTNSTYSTNGLMSDDMAQYNSIISTLGEPDGKEHLPLSQDSVADLKQTAAKLIESLHEVNTNPSHSQLQYDPNDQLLEDVLSDKSSSESSLDSLKRPADNITHYTSMHRGRAQKVPSEVEQSVGTILRDLERGKTMQPTPGKTAHLEINVKHIESALSSTRPSLTSGDLLKYENLYSNFIRSRDKGAFSKPNYYEGKQRATLS